MVEMKGVTLNTTISYNKELLGEDTINSIISKLSAEDQKQLTSTVLDSEWYSVEPFVHFTDALYKEILGSNDHAFSKGSELVAEKQLKGTHKALLLLGNTEAVIDKIGTITDRFYRGITIKTEYLDKKKLKVIYTGFEKNHWLQELVSMAWWRTIFTNLNAKNIATQLTTSLKDGKGYFDFIITWE